MNWLWQIIDRLVNRRRRRKRRTDPPAPPAPVDPPSSIEHALLLLHNRQRQANNLPLLRLDRSLTAAAQSHAAWMSENRELNHIPPHGGPNVRAKHHGYGGMVTENIAWNQRTPNDAVNDWMNSSGHRRNILDDGAVDVGFGVADSSPGDDRDKYWCAMYGRG